MYTRSSLTVLLTLVLTALCALAQETEQKGKDIAGSPARLDFRIAPYAPGEGEESPLSEEQIEQYTQLLVEKGPVFFIRRRADYIWAPLAEGMEAERLATTEYDGKTYLLVSNKKGETLLTQHRGEGAWGLKNARATTNSMDQHVVEITFDENAAERFGKITENHIERCVAILVDGEVLSIPVIMEPFGEYAVISGTFTKDQAEALACLLEKSLPATQPAPAPAEDQQPSPEALALLEKLEAAGDKFATIAADVTYTVENRKLGDRERRTGEMLFVNRTEEKPVRLIFDFETYQLTLGQPIAQRVKYVFDGQWMHVLKYKIKSLAHYQVVAEGEDADPMKIGEGPIPLPIGQDTDEVLKLLFPQTPPAGEDAPDNTDYLRLTPLAEKRDQVNFVALEIWISRDSGLPVKIRAEEKGKIFKTLELSDIETAAEVDESLFEVAKPGPGWTETWEKLPESRPPEEAP
jgi:hypothetical protein